MPDDFELPEEFKNLLPTVGAVTVPAAGAGPLHVRGVVLPEGEHRDLYVVDGRVTYEPVAAPTRSPPGWVVPGLVDAHCHIGLDAHGAVPPDEQERQALTERDAGTLLVRDAGSAADTRWIDDRDDLPQDHPGRPAHRPDAALHPQLRRGDRAGRAGRRGRAAGAARGRLGQAGRRLDRP